MQNNYNYGYNPNIFNQQNKNSIPYDTNRYVYVNGIEGAKAYAVAPGTTIMLIDCDAPIMYKKTADVTGKSILKYFKIIEVSEEELKPVQQNQNVQYATAEQFIEISKKLDDLFNRFEAMSTKIEKPSKNTKMEG